MLDMSEFLEDIRLERTPVPGIAEAIAALEIVERIYAENGRDHRA